MGSVLWLAVPFVVTAVVAMVLHVRDRRARAAAVADRRHEQRARQVRRAMERR